MDKSDIKFVLDLSLRQISLNSIFRPVLGVPGEAFGYISIILKIKGRISKIYLAVSKLFAYLLRRPKLLFTNR